MKVLVSLGLWCKAEKLLMMAMMMAALASSERERGTWSLVCDTEEQWVRLAERLKDELSPQDRQLYRIISQNFLPKIGSMIEHRVGLQMLCPALCAA